MATIDPIKLIEITTSYGKQVPRCVGTRIRVSDIVIMHLRNNTSIEWIVENYNALDHAKVYAALAYYYQHQDEIDAEIDEPEDLTHAIDAEDLLAKMRARLAKKQNTED